MDRDLHNQVQAVREAGHVARMHTVPHHGEYTVAAHSWNMVSLLFLLHPDPSIYLIRAAHFHDCAERHAGDIPGHTKYHHSRTLGEHHAELEQRVMGQLGLGDDQLTDDEKAWLKGCDLLEFFLWCHDQEAMGNRNLTHVLGNVNRWISDNPGGTPTEIIEFMQRYEWKRTHDNGFWNEEGDS